jgi:hypothetical protein
MPEIRRNPKPGLNSPNAPTTVGYGRGAGVEGEAVAQLGQTLTRSVGGLLGEIQQVNDRVNQEELSNEMQSRLSEKMRELSVMKEGDAPDGSDLVEKSREAFTEVQSEVLSKSSGRVRDALSLQSQDMARAFDEQTFSLAQKRMITHTQTKLEDFSNKSAGSVMSAPAVSRGTILLAEKQKYDTLVDDLADKIGVDQAMKLKRANLENLQQGFINSADLDEGSASQVLRAIEGKSGNKDLNSVFESMDANAKGRSIAKLNNIIERQAREFEIKMNNSVTEMKAQNLLGEKFKPGQAAQMIRQVEMSGMKGEDKQALINNIKVEAVTNSYAGDRATMTSAQIAEMSSKAAFDQPGFKASDRVELKSRLEQIASFEIKLRQEDPKAAVDRVPSVQAMRIEADRLLAAGDASGFVKYNQKVLATQEALGMRPSLVSRDEAASFAAQINSISSPQAKVEFLDQKTARYGSLKNRYLGELAQAKAIPDDLAFYTSMSDDVSKATFVKNMQARDLLRDPSFSAKTGVSKVDIEDKVRKAIAKESDALRNNLGLAYISSQIYEQVELETRAQLLQKKPIDEAVEIAHKKVVEANFSTLERGRSKILAPNKLPTGTPLDARRVEAFLETSLKRESIKKMGLLKNKEYSSEDDFVDDIEGTLEWRQNPSNPDELMLYSVTGKGEAVARIKGEAGPKPVIFSMSAISSGNAGVFETDLDEAMRPWSQRFMKAFSQGKSETGEVTTKVDAFLGGTR